MLNVLYLKTENRKPFLLILGWVLFVPGVKAQLTKEQRIQDSVIGWYMGLPPKATKPFVYEGKTFSLRQQETNNRFVEWVQKSYTPVGSTGKYSENYYASRKENKPQAYGTQFRIYNVRYTYLDAKGHFKPIEEEWTPFYLMANYIFGEFPLSYLNKNGSYYFALPRDHSFANEQLKKKMEKADPDFGPAAYNYKTHTFNEWQTVYLIPGNKLPIIPVSYGEYLEQSEKSIDAFLADKRQELAKANPTDPKSVEYYMEPFLKNAEKYRHQITVLKTKYKSRWEEPALLAHSQPEMDDFYGTTDPFELDPLSKKLNGGVLIYKFDPAVYDKAKSEKPVWIAVSIPYYGIEEGRKLYEMSRAMKEHFNYEYVYNYFFDSAKLKGKPYEPRNEASLKSTLAAYAQNSTSQSEPNNATVRLPAGVLLKEDFGASIPGGMPKGWYYNLAGKAPAITKLDGQDGNWLKLGYNNQVSSVGVATLPDYFTLEYDIATDFFDAQTGGSVVLEIVSLEKDNSGKRVPTGIKVQVTAGNEKALREAHNYRGIATLSFYTPEAEGKATITQGVFTNLKKYVHVKLQSKPDGLFLSLNDIPILDSKALRTDRGALCQGCIVRPNTHFTKWAFVNLTQDAEQIGAYISHIQLTKE